MVYIKRKPTTGFTVVGIEYSAIETSDGSFDKAVLEKFGKRGVCSYFCHKILF